MMTEDNFFDNKNNRIDSVRRRNPITFVMNWNTLSERMLV